MSSLISAMDTHTPKKLGENDHPEYDWSHDEREKIAQIFFKLVRGTGPELESQIRQVLMSKNVKPGTREFQVLYKFIGHTRDIVEGKGEYKLAYMLALTFYEYYPELAFRAVELFLESAEVGGHQYGSWKDVKYFCEYVFNKTGNKEHKLIDFMHKLCVKRLRCDWNNYENKHKISLCAKWFPREKSKYSWQFHKMTKLYFGDSSTIHRSKCKQMRQMLATLNKFIDTTQIHMCGQLWQNIDFNHVSSITMNKNKMAFQNLKKDNRMMVERYSLLDRQECARHYKEHLQRAVAGDTTAKVHGKRLNVYELVKSASCATTCEDIDLVNLQWADNSKCTPGTLGNIISMVDTSGSMSCNKSEPLFSAIGLGIRTSEKCSPAFRNRIMTFSDKPKWVKFSDDMTFYEKVKKTQEAPWGMNTNFLRAMDLIIDVIVKNRLSPEETKDMVLAVYSDMQIDSASRWDNLNTLYDNIRDKFSAIGHQTPHILFWNLAGRDNTGFPVLSNQKNVSMLSGFSAVLLNAFCEKGMEFLEDINPWKLICDIVGNPRYDPMNL